MSPSLGKKVKCNALVKHLNTSVGFVRALDFEKKISS